MGKCFWPIYVAVASVSCALVWRFAPALGAHLPRGVRDRICAAVKTDAAFFPGRAVEQKLDTPDAVEQKLDTPGAAEQKLDTPVTNVTKRVPHDPDRTPAERGVRPVDAIHATWGVLTGITSVEKLDGTVMGNVAGGRFFKIKKTISTPSGLMVTGTFIPQKTKQTVRIPTDRINCLSGDPRFLSTNQQACLRMYYKLTGEAEALREKLLFENAKNIPCLQDAAAALRELRAREKAVAEQKDADTDTLRKMTYEISQLRVKFQESDQKYREWKAEHAAEIPDPEKDPAYIEIINRRRRYADAIPGLAF